MIATTLLHRDSGVDIIEDFAIDLLEAGVEFFSLKLLLAVILEEHHRADQNQRISHQP